MVTVVATLGSELHGAVTDVAHLAVNDEDVVVVDGRGTDASLVAEMQSGGVSAVGLSGVDTSGARVGSGRLVRPGVDGKLLLGSEAGVESVNTDLLKTLLDDGYVPVVSGTALARVGGDERVEMAATEVAAAVAGALATANGDPEADVDLVLLSDGHTSAGTVDTVDGFDALREPGADEHELAAAETALAGGVDRVVIGDAGLSDPIIAARGGHGTHIAKEAVA